MADPDPAMTPDEAARYLSHEVQGNRTMLHDLQTRSAAVLVADWERRGKLLRYLLAQYDRVIELHAHVRMDTPEDRELHDRAVRQFQQAAEPVRTALAAAPIAGAPWHSKPGRTS